jgi:hypothetical protein
MVESRHEWLKGVATLKRHLSYWRLPSWRTFEMIRWCRMLHLSRLRVKATRYQSLLRLGLHLRTTTSRTVYCFNALPISTFHPSCV